MVESVIKPILASLKSVISNITIHGPHWVQVWPIFFSFLGYLFCYLSRNAVITNNHDSSFFLFSIQTVVQCFKILSFVKTIFFRNARLYICFTIWKVWQHTQQTHWWPTSPLLLILMNTVMTFCAQWVETWQYYIRCHQF